MIATNIMLIISKNRQRADPNPQPIGPQVPASEAAFLASSCRPAFK